MLINPLPVDKAEAAIESGECHLIIWRDHDATTQDDGDIAAARFYPGF